jgi:hypothetical protein
MSAADHGLVAGQADGDVRTDHVPGHGRSVSPQLPCLASAGHTVRDVQPGHRHE